MTPTSKQPVSPAEPISPAVQAANFRHLYWDVVWYGIAYGSTLSFLAVFATRLGAAGWQVGLVNAVPALVNTFITLPAGRWLENRPLGRAVNMSAFWQRLGFFFYVPIPLLLPMGAQIWAVLLLTLLIAVPGTALAISFNALLAATVPLEVRGHVVGWRNALLAGTIMVAFLVSGWLLDWLPFTWGYAAVFALGAVGGGMSSYHISRVKVPPVPPFQGRPLYDMAQPGRGVGRLGDGSVAQRVGVGMRLWLGRQWQLTGLQGRISRRYRWVMVAFFLFHFAQLLPQSLFPLFWVREVHLSDGVIGWINAVFYLTMLMASPLLAPLTRRLGNHRLAVAGAFSLSIYALLTALSVDATLLFVASVLGGIVWAILSGALINRLIEVVPENDRPVHFAVYNLALNVATLAGNMLGPLLADMAGLREALIIIFILRLIAGAALARWG